MELACVFDQALKKTNLVKYGKKNPKVVSWQQIKMLQKNLPFFTRSETPGGFYSRRIQHNLLYLI